VTGAGRGIGREHALSLGRQGASVVVDDVDGDEAERVARELRDLGAQARASTLDASTWDGAERLVRTAIDAFGDLHVLVCNAGILRDRTVVNMTEGEWDDVVRVHLKGTFAPTHFAAEHWRAQAKAGERVDARVICTSSISGVFGNVGQANYGAAKAGIAAFARIAAVELARYGVTVNALCPNALTRMTEGTILPDDPTEEQQERWHPRWNAPVVTWLASAESRAVTGRVFEARGDYLGVLEGWVRGPRSEAVEDPREVGPVVAALLEEARVPSGMDGLPGSPPQPPPLPELVGGP
jgi:NAD(P)-dependent dehydrogenase (short-subunit alcohol dehydrogenase family)